MANLFQGVSAMWIKVVNIILLRKWRKSADSKANVE